MTQQSFIAGIPLVLGGNVFGWTAKGDDGFAVLDAFYEAGGMRIHTKTGMLSRKVPIQIGSDGDPTLYEPDEVLASLGASLDRLRTGYVDLYYAHRDYEQLDIGGIVEAFEGAVQSGKVRAVGASNFKADRLAAALRAADERCATSFTALQNQYNLFAREDYGPDLQQLCVER